MYEGTTASTFREDGPPVDTLFLTSPARPVYIRCRVLTAQRKSGLITLQIVWFSYTGFYSFLSCIETHVSHVCVRKIMLILTER